MQEALGARRQVEIKLGEEYHPGSERILNSEQFNVLCVLLSTLSLHKKA